MFCALLFANEKERRETTDSSLSELTHTHSGVMLQGRARLSLRIAALQH